MTRQQVIALKRIAGGDCFVHGNNVRVVRACAEYGYATLEDYGSMRGKGMNAERYYATITDKGREFLRQHP